MRTVNAFKVTILCGFITILVLRGTIQAGSGLPDSLSFVDEEVATFQVGLTRTSRVLQAQAEDETPYDATIAGKFVPEVKWDPSKPFSLGPKISNWDQQRRVWNDRNPMRNVACNGKSNILLVSGSQPGPCGNPLGDFYHLKFLKNRIDYAHIHGMEFFYNMATFQKEMNSFWAKLKLQLQSSPSESELENARSAASRPPAHLPPDSQPWNSALAPSSNLILFRQK